MEFDSSYQWLLTVLLLDTSESATWWPNTSGNVYHCYQYMWTPLPVGDTNWPKQKRNRSCWPRDTRQIWTTPEPMEITAWRSIFYFFLKLSSEACLDGSKYFEMRRWELLPDNFCWDCVMTLDNLGNAKVDEIFHIGGLKDLQSLCKCWADPTGAGLLGFWIPPAKSEQE